MKKDAPTGRYQDLLRVLEEARAGGVTWGLERVTRVLTQLGHPERHATVVQIAGTNGKGSTAAMTAGILRAAGLRTGLFTSPHLSRFTERIQLDGSEARRRRAGRPGARDPGSGRSAVVLRAGDRARASGLRRGRHARRWCWRPGSAVAWTQRPPARRSPPQSPASATTTPTNWGRPWPTSPVKRRASRSPGCRCSWARCPPRRRRVWSRVAATVGAPIAFFGRDFDRPRRRPRCPGRTSASTRPWRSSSPIARARRADGGWMRRRSRRASVACAGRAGWRPWRTGCCSTAPTTPRVPACWRTRLARTTQGPGC